MAALNGLTRDVAERDEIVRVGPDGAYAPRLADAEQRHRPRHADPGAAAAEMPLLPLLIAAAAVTAPLQALPVAYRRPRDPRIRTAAPSFGWPGVYFEGRFRGTGIRVRFDAPAELCGCWSTGWRNVTSSGAGPVDAIFDHLPPGVHVVRLEKLSESQQGGGRFLGFFPLPGGTAAPPLRAAAPDRVRRRFLHRRLRQHLPTRTCTPAEIHDRTDTQQAFGPLVARHYDADDRIIAYSGFGIVRNYSGSSPGLNLPALYDRLKPDDPRHLETAAPGWHPQLIVINLGTNDFSTPAPCGRGLARRRRRSPPPIAPLMSPSSATCCPPAAGALHPDGLRLSSPKSSRSPPR